MPCGPSTVASRHVTCVLNSTISKTDRCFTLATRQACRSRSYPVQTKRHLQSCTQSLPVEPDAAASDRPAERSQHQSRLMRKLHIRKDLEPDALEVSRRHKTLRQRLKPRVGIASILNKYLPEIDKSKDDPATVSASNTMRRSTVEEVAVENPESEFIEPSWEEIEVLTKDGYGPDDLRSWVTFLSAQTPNEAVSNLQSRMLTDPDYTYPMFILSQFLLRPDLQPATLCIILDALNRHHKSTRTHSITAWLTVFTRFTEHARKVAPLLIEDVTQSLLTRLKAGHNSASTTTAVVNKALLLIGYPTRLRPYGFAAMQERALVQVLQFMADHSPPLPLKLEGYYAFVRVHLLLSKTEQERHWAQLKSQSWPPWKQDRTAMDSLLGPEHGISKAAQTMLQMNDAGYTSPMWASVAGIYAGHDVDGTPTIQTRAILPECNSKNLEAKQWAARITATRTLQEAWACWLAYEDSRPGRQPATSAVLAIMGKLHARVEDTNRDHSSLEKSDTDEYQEHLPGDTRELWPEPASSHLRTYTKTPPPDLYRFFQSFRQKGWKLDRPVMAFLINNASTYAQGVEYALAQNQNLSKLLNSRGGDAIPEWLAPPEILAACANLLLRFPRGKMEHHFSHRHNKVGIPSNIANEAFPIRLNTRFMRAIWILSLINLGDERTRFWRPVFSWFSNKPRLSFTFHQGGQQGGRQPAFEYSHPNVVHRFHSFRGTMVMLRLGQQVVQLMNARSTAIDENIFAAMCRAVARAGDGYHWALNMQAIAEKTEVCSKMLPYSLITDEGKAVLAEGPDKYLKLLYDDMTGQTGLLHVPALGAAAPFAPAVLHLWVGALGAWRLHKSIQELVHWVCRENTMAFDEEIVAHRRHFRRFVLALRAFLEHSGPYTAELLDHRHLGKRGAKHYISSDFLKQMYILEHQPAPPDLIADIRYTLEERFGSKLVAWPSYEKAEDYMLQYVDRVGQI